MTDEHFAIVTRDELWSLDRHTRLESRLNFGSAQRTGPGIEAKDDCDERLLEECDRQSARVRETLIELKEGRARWVVSACREGDVASVLTTISLTVLDLSLVTTLPHMRSDHEMLVEMASVRPEAAAEVRGVPIVWRNGSGAVLLHEAAGHPAEHAHAPLRWPPWLSAVDESAAGTSDLLAGEAPRALRRQSFSDIPLRRMSNVVVAFDSSANGEGGLLASLPDRRIEVLLVAGGRYEPLTETVAFSIAAADRIEGDNAVRLRPFVIRETRAAVAKAIRGAAGSVQRYPGVICSKEGQELLVGSSAPDLLTEF